MSAPGTAGGDAGAPGPGKDPPRALAEGPVERVCRIVSMAALAVMLGVTGLDIVTRSLFNFSFEISDEIGGYMLVVIAFVSLPVCQTSGSFHHVAFVQSRLPPRGRAVSQVVFGLLSLAFCAALVWQLGRMEGASWRFGDEAPTYLATPLWIPRLAMVAGAAALAVTVARTLVADIARLFTPQAPPWGAGEAPREGSGP